jgi:DNA polymerase III epsilon subunit-like protein
LGHALHERDLEGADHLLAVGVRGPQAAAMPACEDQTYTASGCSRTEVGVTRYVVVDTETTGTVPGRDRVVWVASAVLDDGIVAERWSTLLDPGPDSRARVAGIDLAGQPTFTHIARRLARLLRGNVLVAHNAPFDVAFLAAEYERAGLVMPKVPVICTLRLAHRLGLDVASLSLVDCCAYFGISHRRRHRADEDVEATVQLLQRLLPLASERGWSDVDALIDALAPVGGSELVYTFEINVEEILAQLLVEKAGWRPEQESAEEAMARYGCQMRAERDAAYARMQPEHRAAHQRKDALGADERRASAWLPVLEALEAAGCPEAADSWVEYARCIQGPARNARRVLAALHHALELYLSSPGVTRTKVNDAVTWISITCDDAKLPDELITAYQAFGPRLAALPPCGECGNLTFGCTSGGACTRADLASRAARAPFDFDPDAEGAENPQLVERRARAVLPLLAEERDLAAYVRLGARFGGRLVAWGRVQEALAVWDDVLAGCSGRDVPSLADQTDRFAETLVAAKRYTDAIVVAEPAVEAARQQGQGELFWRTADHLASYLERAGRLEQATSLWHEAVGAGSTIPRTFDRLSLALDRAGHPSAAVQVCEIGLARFSDETRRSNLVQRIEKRAERCRVKAPLAD